MNGYPYPVLTEVDSGYKADINFNIEFSKYACKDDKIVLSLGVELNSETLKNHKSFSGIWDGSFREA